MVAGTVGSSYTSAVENESYSGLVQGHIHEHLVEGSVYESGIKCNHRMQTTECHTSSRSNCVLLGNANVKNSLWISLGKCVKTNRLQHCTCNCNYFGALSSNFDELLTKNRSPGLARRSFEGLAACRVNFANRVKLVIFV